MEKQGKWLAPIACMIMPLIPLLYLYTRNAEYVSAAHVLVVGAALAVFWLIIFYALRLIFRSRFAALAGCLTALAFFIGMRSASGLQICERAGGYGGFAIIYLSAALVTILLVALILRGRQGGGTYLFVMIIVGLLVAYNGAAAIRTGADNERKAGGTPSFKTQFSVSLQTPTPNVYWIHCDGMLGFDAFEKYFGDDQAEFAEALKARGFEINRGAMAETTHRTKVAIPSLMCPYFYDNTLKDLLQDHETAMANVNTLSKYPLQSACMNNELRLAFEQKGYLSQTFGNINAFLPPVSDRVYTTIDDQLFLLETKGDIQAQYLPLIEADELASLLTGMPESALVGLTLKLSDRGLFGLDMRREELGHTLTKAQLEALANGQKLSRKTGLIMEAINDSTYVDQPTFDFFYYLGAHFPFKLDENGAPNLADPGDIFSYPPQHRYAASVLIIMIDAILERDPDAVIVLEADHGLHGQSADQITAAFGSDAVIPIWNQVMSALRVPAKYQNGQEFEALSDPLNMSRYLVNAFVGVNYPYR